LEQRNGTGQPGLGMVNLDYGRLVVDAMRFDANQNANARLKEYNSGFPRGMENKLEMVIEDHLLM